jgi:hypothetical protein
MSNSRYGILAGIAGAAFAAWWWRRRASLRSIAGNHDTYGETIYRNTPEPTGITGLGGGPT